MFEILPAWSGQVVAALHRCSITREELAMESEISPTYLSSLLHDPHPAKSTCEKVNVGLERCMRKRGIPLNEFLTGLTN